MNCHSFRRAHVLYVDDLLSGTLMEQARAHIASCTTCAKHDRVVRRGMMLVRNLPPMEPSAQFSERLAARLAECRQELDARGGVWDENDPCVPTSVSPDSAWRDAAARRGWSARHAWLAAAAGVAIVATVAASDWGSAPRDLIMPPVAASAPPPFTLPPMVSAELVQAAAAGNPMWPMALLMEDGASQFLTATYADPTIQLATFER